MGHKCRVWLGAHLLLHCGNGHAAEHHPRANSQYGHGPCTMPKHTGSYLMAGFTSALTTSDPVKEYHQVIKSAVKQMIQANELPVSAKNLILQTPRTSRFYLLPKIHKENNPGRPIVSACNCPTENTASYLDMVMSPLVCNLKTYAKDSDHALQIFRTFQFDNDDTSQRFLYMMDIKSLYTVIPHNSGLEALKYFLHMRPVLDPPTVTLTRLAELVLTLNAFSFNNEFYHHVGRVAMGSKMGPNYACLFVECVEEQIEYNESCSTISKLLQTTQRQALSFLDHQWLRFDVMATCEHP